MFAAFAAAKAKAAKATKFRKGGSVNSDGVVEGDSHENGGVGFEVEGGEFLHTDGRRLSVINKKSTQAEFSLLAAINKSDQAGMDRWALNRVATLNRAAVSSAVSSGTIIVKEDRTAHGLLQQIRDKKRTETIVWEEKGYQVTKTGNHIRRVKLTGK
jgi:hypothetical protein